MQVPRTTVGHIRSTCLSRGRARNKEMAGRPRRNSRHRVPGLLQSHRLLSPSQVREPHHILGRHGWQTKALAVRLHCSQQSNPPLGMIQELHLLACLS